MYKERSLLEKDLHHSKTTAVLCVGINLSYRRKMILPFSKYLPGGFLQMLSIENKGEKKLLFYISK